MQRFCSFLRFHAGLLADLVTDVAPLASSSHSFAVSGLFTVLDPDQPCGVGNHRNGGELMQERTCHLREDARNGKPIGINLSPGGAQDYRRVDRQQASCAAR